MTHIFSEMLLYSPEIIAVNGIQRRQNRLLRTNLSSIDNCRVVSGVAESYSESRPQLYTQNLMS